jgi:hypothetical protein
MRAHCSFRKDIPVRELMGRVCNVVLMNVYLDLENPGGVGILCGRVYEPGEGIGKLVYDGSCHSKEGSK